MTTAFRTRSPSRAKGSGALELQRSQGAAIATSALFYTPLAHYQPWIIYCWRVAEAQILLIARYAKNVRTDLTPAQLKLLAKFVEALKWKALNSINC